MIGLPRGVSVYAYDEPCDMRKSFDTLTAIVVEQMKHDVLAGDVYLFISRDRRRTKVLLPDVNYISPISDNYTSPSGCCSWAPKRPLRGRLVALIAFNKLALVRHRLWSVWAARSAVQEAVGSRAVPGLVTVHSALLGAAVLSPASERAKRAAGRTGSWRTPTTTTLPHRPAPLV